ncbi:cupin domain-containing protein [Amycolatopsis sp. NPDC004368]
MDPVNSFLRAVQVESTLDLRCLIAGRFELDREAVAAGLVPFHLVLEGSCTVTTAASTTELKAGDLLLLPRGDAHRVSVVTTAPRWDVADTAGPAFPTRRSVGAEPELDLYSGHYRFDPAAGLAVVRTLPPVVHVALGISLAGLSHVLRGETRFGDDSLVRSLFGVLLGIALRPANPGR